MRSIVYSSTGISDVLRLAERDIPGPGPGEVRVRMLVSGVNPTDWKRRAAQTGQSELGGDVVPNQDGAGVVDALGDGVTGLAIGDRVWIYPAQHESPQGTAQEFTVVAADKAVSMPASVSFDVGASLGVPAMTAHRALTVHEDGPTRLAPGALAGRTVLVTGGAGAVGHAAIQLAKWAGATVITTVSSEGKAARAPGLPGEVPQRVHLPLRATRLEAPAPRGAAHQLEDRGLIRALKRQRRGGAIQASAPTPSCWCVSSWRPSRRP